MQTLAPMAAAGADAGQIADAASAVWHSIHAALAPVIGGRGSTALFHRSLHVTRMRHEWLPTGDEASAEPGEFRSLHSALALQTAVDAAAAHDTMLHTFLDLLTSLLGEPLTQRLLQDVWAPPSSGPAVKDTSP